MNWPFDSLISITGGGICGVGGGMGRDDGCGCNLPSLKKEMESGVSGKAFTSGGKKMKTPDLKKKKERCIRTVIFVVMRLWRDGRRRVPEIDRPQKFHFISSVQP